jgi:hypothetical protein
MPTTYPLAFKYGNAASATQAAIGATSVIVESGATGVTAPFPIPFGTCMILAGGLP